MLNGLESVSAQLDDKIILAERSYRAAVSFNAAHQPHAVWARLLPLPKGVNTRWVGWMCLLGARL